MVQIWDILIYCHCSVSLNGNLAITPIILFKVNTRMELYILNYQKSNWYTMSFTGYQTKTFYLKNKSKAKSYITFTSTNTYSIVHSFFSFRIVLSCQRQSNPKFSHVRRFISSTFGGCLSCNFIKTSSKERGL